MQTLETKRIKCFKLTRQVTPGVAAADGKVHETKVQQNPQGKKTLGLHRTGQVNKTQVKPIRADERVK